MILVTGYNGFVGSALFNTLQLRKGVPVRGSSRREVKGLKTIQDVVITGEIDGNTAWQAALNNCRTVIHTAALTHQVDRRSSGVPLEKYREINTAGTLNLAKQAACEGVNRFIFLSSIKVNGEFTPLNVRFSSDDTPNPTDAYAISKHEAEVGLEQIADETDMEVVIIRSPLVYGPGVKSNFAALVGIISKGFPLPFGLVVNNHRSLVALDNLIDLIITCVNHPEAANKTFLVSDGVSLSTAELVKNIAKAMSKKPRLFPIPLWLIRIAGRLFGQEEKVMRLLDSLEIDITNTRDILGWLPPISLDEGIRRAVENIDNTLV